MVTAQKHKIMPRDIKAQELVYNCSDEHDKELMRKSLLRTQKQMDKSYTFMFIGAALIFSVFPIIKYFSNIYTFIYSLSAMLIGFGMIMYGPVQSFRNVGLI